MDLGDVNMEFFEEDDPNLIFDEALNADFNSWLDPQSLGDGDQAGDLSAPPGSGMMPDAMFYDPQIGQQLPNDMAAALSGQPNQASHPSIPDISTGAVNPTMNPSSNMGASMGPATGPGIGPSVGTGANSGVNSPAAMSPSMPQFMRPGSAHSAHSERRSVPTPTSGPSISNSPHASVFMRSQMPHNIQSNRATPVQGPPIPVTGNSPHGPPMRSSLMSPNPASPQLNAPNAKGAPATTVPQNTPGSMRARPDDIPSEGFVRRQMMQPTSMSPNMAMMSPNMARMSPNLSRSTGMNLTGPQVGPHIGPQPGSHMGGNAVNPEMGQNWDIDRSMLAQGEPRMVKPQMMPTNVGAAPDTLRNQSSNALNNQNNLPPNMMGNYHPNLSGNDMQRRQSMRSGSIHSGTPSPSFPTKDDTHIVDETLKRSGRGSGAQALPKQTQQQSQQIKQAQQAQRMQQHHQHQQQQQQQQQRVRQMQQPQNAVPAPPASVGVLSTLSSAGIDDAKLRRTLVALTLYTQALRLGVQTANLADVLKRVDSFSPAEQRMMINKFEQSRKDVASHLVNLPVMRFLPQVFWRAVNDVYAQIHRPPVPEQIMFGGHRIPLMILFQYVQISGGLVQASLADKWVQIAQALGINIAPDGSPIIDLVSLYVNTMLPFEMFADRNEVIRRNLVLKLGPPRAIPPVLMKPAPVPRSALGPAKQMGDDAHISAVTQTTRQTMPQGSQEMLQNISSPSYGSSSTGNPGLGHPKPGGLRTVENDDAASHAGASGLVRPGTKSRSSSQTGKPTLERNPLSGSTGAPIQADVYNSSKAAPSSSSVSGIAGDGTELPSHSSNPWNGQRPSNTALPDMSSKRPSNVSDTSISNKRQRLSAPESVSTAVQGFVEDGKYLLQRQHISTHGGRDVRYLSSLGNDIQNWYPEVAFPLDLGTVDLHAVTCSLASRIPAEVRQALDKLAAVSANPKVHESVQHCPRLLANLCDLILSMLHQLLRPPPSKNSNEANPYALKTCNSRPVDLEDDNVKLVAQCVPGLDAMNNVLKRLRDDPIRNEESRGEIEIETDPTTGFETGNTKSRPFAKYNRTRLTEDTWPYANCLRKVEEDDYHTNDGDNLDACEDWGAPISEFSGDEDKPYYFPSYGSRYERIENEIYSLDDPKDENNTFWLTALCDRLLLATCVLRNLSFSVANRPVIAHKPEFQRLLWQWLQIMAENPKILDTELRTLDLNKDFLTVLGNVGLYLRLPDTRKTLDLMLFLLSFSPVESPYTADGKIKLMDFDIDVHRYLPNAIDVFVKVALREDPNRRLIEEVLLGTSKDPVYHHLINRWLKSQKRDKIYPAELLTRMFSLAVAMLPLTHFRPPSRDIETRQPYLLQGSLAAEVIVNMIPDRDVFHYDIAANWLNSVECFGARLVRTMNFMGMVVLNQVDGESHRPFAKVTQRCVHVIQKLFTKAKMNPEFQATGIVPSIEHLLGGLMAAKMDKTVVKHLSTIFDENFALETTNL